MALLRQPLLLLSRSTQVKRLVSSMPVSAGIVRSYVPGETTAAVVEATADEIADGLQVSLDFLGEDTTDVEQAEATVAAYVEILKELSTRGLTRGLVATRRSRSSSARSARRSRTTARRSRSRTLAPSAARPATPAPR